MYDLIVSIESEQIYKYSGTCIERPLNEKFI